MKIIHNKSESSMARKKDKEVSASVFKAEDQEAYAFYLKNLGYIQNSLIALLYLRKCTVAQLAEKAEISPKLIQDFIDGTDLFTMDTKELIRISCALEIPLCWLFTEPGRLRAIVKEYLKVDRPPVESIREKVVCNS